MSDNLTTRVCTVWKITKGKGWREGKSIKSSRRGIYKFLKAGLSDPS